MGFFSASKSVLSAIAGALITTHSWQYNASRGQRTCTCCGRQEEMVLDLVSTNWEMLAPGDPAAHAVRTVPAEPSPCTEPDLAAARTPGIST
ncbi:hypothetical protein ABIB38_002828 [Massilia sp. UYP11]|uniref:hypothetical protein n=1 Tax=Massilia sp. UYP11 TaxID=1756385 RepID=UPI003D1F8760